MSVGTCADSAGSLDQGQAAAAAVGVSSPDQGQLQDYLCGMTADMRTAVKGPRPPSHTAHNAATVPPLCLTPTISESCSNETPLHRKPHAHNDSSSNSNKGSSNRENSSGSSSRTAHISQATPNAGNAEKTADPAWSCVGGAAGAAAAAAARRAGMQGNHSSDLAASGSDHALPHRQSAVQPLLDHLQGMTADMRTAVKPARPQPLTQQQQQLNTQSAAVQPLLDHLQGMTADMRTVTKPAVSLRNKHWGQAERVSVEAATAAAEETADAAVQAEAATASVSAGSCVNGAAEPPPTFGGAWIRATQAGGTARSLPSSATPAAGKVCLGCV